MTDHIEICSRRLADLLAEVNQFGATDSGGSERLAWSRPETTAREWLLDRCAREGLEVEQDEAGNVWAWGGSQPAVVMGSHLDTVPDGGRFDGSLGVMAALEVLLAVRRGRHRHADRLALLCFTDEEGVRFSTGMTGSRALAGTLGTDELAGATNPAGDRLWDALIEQGLDPERVPAVAARRAGVASYLELHIEQGRQLEARNEPVGAVQTIAGISSWHLQITGQANHAGTTRVDDRRDALLPVSAAIGAARQMMRNFPGLAATVGQAAVTGGAGNIVPGSATCSLDVRSTSTDELQTAVEKVLQAARRVAEDTDCQLEAHEVKRVDPVSLDSEVRAAITRSQSACATPELDSMAGHDAMNLAAVGVPTGMVFVRSRGGRSHCPEEHSSPADCAAGAQRLADAAVVLAGRVT